MTTTPATSGNGSTETFRFLAWAWNLSMAKPLAEGRTPGGRLDPAQWRGLLGTIRLDDDYIGDVDLSVPLIAVPIPDAGLFIIDGWHRIARALREEITELPVIVLTAEEEYTCRIYGGDKQTSTIRIF